MSMSLGSVLKGPRFHRMESVKLMQYRSNLQYSVYLPYVFFWLASLCHLCRSPLPLPYRSPLPLPLLLPLPLPLMLVHISSLPLWLIEKRLKYKRHGLFREKRCIRKTLLKSIKTISFKRHNLFSFQKRKQSNPAKLFIKEI